MSTTVRPIRNQIVAIRLEAPEKIGSLFLPEKSRDANKTGRVRVVSVGPDVKGDIKPHDEAVIAHFSGADVEIDGVAHIILKEEDLLAILDPTE